MVSANYLEQLAAEWFEYRGYFVRRHVLVGPRDGGGFEAELTVVAIHLRDGEVVQVEPSMDAHSWEKREKRYTARFDAGRRFIPDLVGQAGSACELKQIALIGLGSSTNHPTLGGADVLSLADFLVEILGQLRGGTQGSTPVPQQYPILRTLQFVAENHRAVVPALMDLDPRQLGF